MIYQRQKSKFTCMNTCSCGKPWVHSGGAQYTSFIWRGACAPGALPLLLPMQAELSVTYLQTLLPLAGELKKGALGAFWFHSISSLAKTCFLVIVWVILLKATNLYLLRQFPHQWLRQTYRILPCRHSADDPICMTLVRTPSDRLAHCLLTITGYPLAGCS